MTEPSPLQILVSPFAGRTYHSDRDLPLGTCVLDISTPYAYTIYKQFRTEVCAECWKYDGGRRAFLTARELGESAGISFCDDRCKERWLAREGQEMVELLSELEGARGKSKQNKRSKDTVHMASVQEITEEHILQAWDLVREKSTQARTLRQWKNLILDDFQADLARYVLMSLYHYARELHSESPRQLHEDVLLSSPLSQEGNQPNCPLRFGQASWSDFAALQSGELQQVRKFPALLSDHIRIFQVVKSRFGSQDSRSATRAKLAEVIAIDNVRTALSVDPGNSFGIWEVPLIDESEGLGFGVYPAPSFFNHHCSPNIRKERVGRSLRLITTRGIGAREELCISYGHLESLSVEKRREELEDGWFFRCQCSRCRTEEASSEETQPASI